MPPAMASPSISLCQIPAELTRRIASHSDATTLLSLCLTCRTIKAACWDAFVIQDIVKEAQSIWPCNTFRADLVSSQIGLKKDLWIRVAIADQRAAELRHGIDGSFKDDHLERFLDWAPHLVWLNRKHFPARVANRVKY